MSGASVTFAPRVLTPERRVYVQWFAYRWYFRCAWHECFTKRKDNRNRFLWVALGPLDVRVHVKQKKVAHEQQ